MKVKAWAVIFLLLPSGFLASAIPRVEDAKEKSKSKSVREIDTPPKAEITKLKPNDKLQLALGQMSESLGQLLLSGMLGGAMGSIAGESTVEMSGGELDIPARIQHMGAGFYGGVSVGLQLKKEATLMWAAEQGFDTKNKELLALDSNLRMELAKQYMQGGMIAGIVGAGILSLFTVSLETDGPSASMSSASASIPSSNPKGDQTVEGGKGAINAGGPPQAIQMSANMPIIHNGFAGLLGGAVCGYFAPEIITYGGVLGEAVKEAATQAGKYAGQAVTYAEKELKDAERKHGEKKQADKARKLAEEERRAKETPVQPTVVDDQNRL